MTYSILIYDRSSDKLGAGVVSGSIAVGSRVPWGRWRLGVVATQGYTNPLLAVFILDFLEKGFTAKEALEKALSKDPNPEYRQVAVLSVDSGAATHTGEYVPIERKSVVGDDCIGIGNLLSSEEVVDVLVSTCKRSTKSLESRILDSLLEASHAGGDARGDRSSAILIFGEHSMFKGYDKLLDLRIDYSEKPVEDLINLYELYKKRY